MIILTKTGGKIVPPLLIAYDGAVYAYRYYGDERYIDPYDGSSWYYGVDNGLIEIVGARQDDGVILVEAANVADCVALPGSYFWDNLLGIIYVHWYYSYGDHGIARDIEASPAFLNNLVAGFSSGYHRLTQNVFDGIYYESRITKITGLNKSVDPLKFGLISFKESTFTLTNHDGYFDDITEEETVGLPVQFYYVPDDATELTDDMRVFTGYLKGAKNNRDEITFTVQETRLYENKPICRNAVNATDYPDADDQNLGKLLPVAYGDIRRGIMIPIDLGAITDPPADPTTITFVVADPSLYSVLSIDHVYDSDDNEYEIDSVDLVNNTVTITSADYGGTVDEFLEYDFDSWSWEGTGYDIDGTYDNGLDIIRSLFLDISDVPYLTSTYDTTQWALERGINDEKVGISVQTDRGFIEAVVQPITVSLQGIVDILGDGRISFESRDITDPVADTIYAYDQLKEPDIDMVSDETVSDIVITYSPNFVNDEKNLSYLYDVDRDEVINRFGIDSREPISPIETVLFDEADVITMGADIMETSSSPDQRYTVESIKMLNARLFDIIGFDIGRWSDENLQYGELLSIDPDYINGTEKIVIRKIDNPVVPVVPANPKLISAVVYAPGCVTLRWDTSPDMSISSYKLFYTANAPFWGDAVINYTVFSYDSDLKLCANITGLHGGEIYYFRIKAHNVAGDSEYSNVRFCNIWTDYNAYMADGDYMDGMALSPGNANSGTPIAGWTIYDSTTYDAALYSPAAYFLSGTNFNINKFISFVVVGYSEFGNIYMQYRTSNDNITWGAWSADIDIDGEVSIVPNTFYLEYRIKYHPVLWSDDDYFRIKELN